MMPKALSAAIVALRDAHFAPGRSLYVRISSHTKGGTCMALIRADPRQLGP